MHYQGGGEERGRRGEEEEHGEGGEVRRSRERGGEDGGIGGRRGYVQVRLNAALRDALPSLREKARG